MSTTLDSVGDWGGQEELAARNFDRIIDAINTADPDLCNVLCKYAWNDWGSDKQLLTITDREIAEYVTQAIPTKK